LTGTTTIRVATPDDGAAVSELLKLAYPVLMAPAYDNAVLTAAMPLMTQANRMLLASGSYYLAISDERRTVACGGWTRERPGSSEIVPSLGHMRHFATHPDWIGTGLGREIYARCEREAQIAGVTRFECFSSLNAEGFYSALGFRCLRKIAVRLGPNVTFPGVLMERSIS